MNVRSVSNTMEAEWCKETIEEAILKYGKREIINTDQGSQYTSETFTNLLLSREIKLSMDGKGRALDNIRPLQYHKPTYRFREDLDFGYLNLNFIDFIECFQFSADISMFSGLIPFNFYN